MVKNNLRKFREEAGLSQEKLAALAGLTGGFIGQIERGETTNVGIETLKKIAKALGVSILKLIKNEAA